MSAMRDRVIDKHAAVDGEENGHKMAHYTTPSQWAISAYYWIEINNQKSRYTISAHLSITLIYKLN